MLKNKQILSIAVFLSLIGSVSFSVSASDLVAIHENVPQAIPPTYPSIVQNRSISMKSIEDKMSNILNPAKKDGGNKVNRKQLVSDDSGSCGTSVTYTFTASTGKLTISGSGAMTDYSSISNVPWHSYRNSITSVTIGSGVTSICRSAFMWCHGLTSVTIPSSVTSIGNDAFSCCYGLTSVTIPSSVTSIGNDAFCFCSAMTSISVNSSNSNYQSINGILYSKGGKTLIQCPAGKTGSLTIPNSVTLIGNGAFSHCTGLTSVTIPSSVTSIGNDAFYSCSGLTGTLTIPSSVTSIRSGAFRECSGLTGELTIPSSVTSIGDNVFSDCTGLTSVTIPSSVTEIGLSPFEDCSAMTSISVNSSNSNYQSINGILYSKGGKILIQCPAGKTGSLTIPNSVTYIGNYAFSGCTGLTQVTIPDSVAVIRSYAFSDCTGLTSVTIPSSVTEIKSYAFDYCTGLTSVTIPSSVTSIGSSAFRSCKGLTQVTYKGTSDPGASSSSVFYKCNQLKAVNVPSDYVGDTFCGKPIKNPSTDLFTSFSQSVYNQVLYLIKLVNCYILFWI